ncbi:MAG: hypothetical protein AMK69_04120, partial [Nitrospira bacterium SG8_3]
FNWASSILSFMASIAPNATHWDPRVAGFLAILHPVLDILLILSKNFCPALLPNLRMIISVQKIL